MVNNDKTTKFKKIAEYRTKAVLNDLRKLGNCSNTQYYAYTEEEITKIFSAIEEKIKDIKTLFKVSLKKGKEFNL